MAGTMDLIAKGYTEEQAVSMESGLDGRNNDAVRRQRTPPRMVSMESGLDGRNNTPRNSLTRFSASTSQWSPA